MCDSVLVADERTVDIILTIIFLLFAISLIIAYHYLLCLICMHLYVSKTSRQTPAVKS